MITIIIIIVCVIIYYIVGIATDKEAERQRKQDPLNRESLEKFTIKKNLFLLFKEYLYVNINEFKNIGDFKIIRNKIEQDFPNYGNGICGSGIISDLSRYDLFYKNYNEKIQLGRTFQIISIAYPNFNSFATEIYRSDFKMRYSKGGYYSEFGDDINSIIFYVEFKDAKFFFGLSSGEYKLSSYERRHNTITEKDEMYLFSELQLYKNSKLEYPHFDIKKIRKDIPIKEYHEFFNKNLEMCKTLILI